MKRKTSIILVCIFLTFSILPVYWQTGNHDFVIFDDQQYVTKNGQIHNGLTWETIVWSFSNFHAGNWHPLTWISHTLDYQLYGFNPAGHHLTNVILHLFNSLLVFFIFYRMTEGLWQSACLSALFALHPLHVESVVWVAERKDLLCTFFGMLTLYAYIVYVEKPTAIKYGIGILFFALGILSKPMIVTMPFILLLLDYWPLQRMRLTRSSKSLKILTGKNKIKALLEARLSISWLIIEKIPFFALSAISCIVTVLAQERAVGTLEAIPLEYRITNALNTYWVYMQKMFWPQDLAVFYPHPLDTLLVKEWGLAAVVIIAITGIFLFRFNKFPYLAVGWFWYLGTLVPVIGLVQVGLQAMADRYTYIPLIGLFIVVCWGMPDLLRAWRYKKEILSSLVVGALFVLAVVTWHQIAHWKNSKMLFEHALKVTKDNAVAHDNLGIVLEDEGKYETAIAQYREALRIKNVSNKVLVHSHLGRALVAKGEINKGIDHLWKALSIETTYKLAHGDAYFNLGNAFLKMGKYDAAISYFLKALEISPNNVPAHMQLGIAFIQDGRVSDGFEELSKALNIDPDNETTHFNFAIALFERDEFEKAIQHFEKALTISPNKPLNHAHLGLALARKGRFGGSMEHLRTALKLDTKSPISHYYMGLALFLQGESEEALSYYSTALQLMPNYTDVHYSKGQLLSFLNRHKEAIPHYIEVLRLSPKHADAHNNLGVAVLKIGKAEDAVVHFTEALRINPKLKGARENLEYAVQFKSTTVVEDGF